MPRLLLGCLGKAPDDITPETAGSSPAVGTFPTFFLFFPKMLRILSFVINQIEFKDKDFG